MAHFPAEFLDDVLARTDLVELISRHVQLKKSGANFMGLCPFHQEKSPSFSVSPDKQLYYCFGCGKGGSAFQFLMEHDGYSFPEVVEYLAEKAGLEMPRDSGPASGDDAQRAQALALLERAADFFAKALKAEQGKPAREYLERRGLPGDLIRHYGLGYAPPGYGFMQKCFGRDERTLARLAGAGLLFKGEHGYADRFRARVMFPIRDRRAHVAGFGGRLLDAGEPKYLNSPETPYYHKSSLLYGLAEHREQIRKRKQLIVVEGYMDVLALAAHGFPVGLAPLGTAIGERQLREILRLHVEPVFCFDGDRAGRQAAWRALDRMLPILNAEHGPRFLYLPEGEDPDSLLRKEGAGALARQLEGSAPVLETWLAGLRLLAGSGAEGRARMAKKADSMLARMQDDYLKQAWRQEAEAATGLRLQQRLRPPAPARSAAHRPPDLREHLTAALLRKPERAHALPDDVRNFLLDGSPSNKIYTRALQLMAQGQAEHGNVIRALMREFPEDQRIPRWANQADITDGEFSGLLLAVQAEFIRQRLKRGNDGLEETIRLKQRLLEINQQRRG